MKKTFTLSISGRLFQVEEDAYALLLDYLDSLSDIFRGADGQEIVSDIESRISELFQYQVDAGKVVFTIQDAEAVISTIGNAEQLAGDEIGSELPPVAEDDDEAADERLDSEYACQAPSPLLSQEATTKRKLYRSTTNKVIGGVLGGVAERFDMNPLPLRIIVVLLLIPLQFFPMFLAYCIAWAIIPAANTPERKLEQMGKPVTVANIGEVVSAQGLEKKREKDSALHVLGALIMGFLGFIAGSIGVAMVMAIVGLLLGILGLTIGMTIPEFSSFVAYGEFADITAPWQVSVLFLMGVCICTAILVPCIAMVWAACSTLFDVKGASRGVWITGVIVMVAALLIPSLVIPLCIF